MNQLNCITPQILSVTHQDPLLEMILYVPPELDYFKGHFKVAPILAGVVQLDWAVKYAKQYLGLADLAVQNVEVLKFQVVIIPDMTITLKIEKKTETKFVFSYHSVRGQHASGRVVLGHEL